MNADTSARIDPGVRVLYYTFDGSTTDFFFLLDPELANLDDMTLERTSYGKIVFSSTIDLTQDADVNNVVDLDSNVNISHNYVKINTTRLTSLDSPAVITLYDIFVQNPRVLRDGIGCPVSICSVIGYSNVTGTVVFSVAYFGLSVYSIEETPEQIEVFVPGAGGGGGGVPALPKNITKKVLLELDAPSSKTLYAGDDVDILITLENKGDFELRSIVLNKKTNAPNISLTFSRDFFDKLGVGEEDSLALNIESLVSPKAHIGINRYFVTVVADVGNYDYSSSITFFMDVVERDYEKRMETLKEVTFAEDLFKEYPDCLEFGDLLEQAKYYYNQSDYEKAISLIDAAIQSCRDVIAPMEEWEEEAGLIKTGMAYLFGRVFDSKNILNMFILLIVILLILSLLLAMSYYRRKSKGKGDESQQQEIANLGPRFGDLCNKTRRFIRRGDVVNARKRYSDLNSLYETIRNSPLPNATKSAYYEKLLAIHSELSKKK